MPAPEHFRPELMPAEPKIPFEKFRNETFPEAREALYSCVENFGRGFVHGSVELPVNAAVQLANQASHAHLPELQLVDEKAVEQTVAGRAGTVAGVSADLAGLTLALRGLM
jgi:hypothetical protein